MEACNKKCSFETCECEKHKVVFEDSEGYTFSKIVTKNALKTLLDEQIVKECNQPQYIGDWGKLERFFEILGVMYNL